MTKKTNDTTLLKKDKLYCAICREQIKNTTLLDHVRSKHPEVIGTEAEHPERAIGWDR